MSGLGLCTLNPLSVILTDFKEVKSLLDSNIDLNCIIINNLSMQDCIRSKFSARAFSWGTTLMKKENKENYINNVNLNDYCVDMMGMKDDAEGGSEGGRISDTDSLLEVDLVIASDVVYDPAGYEPLVKSLCDLLGGNYKSWEGGESKEETKEEGCCQEGEGEYLDVTAECSYNGNAINNIISDNEKIKQNIDPISMKIINADYSISSTASNSSTISSSLIESIHPICILAHRHRHPENQR